MYVKVGLITLRYWKQVLIALVSLFAIIFVVILSAIPQNPFGNPDYGGSTPKVSPEVIRWEPTVKEYVLKYGLEEKWVPVLLSIMQQESGGVLADVMQSSESAGFPPNTFSNPVVSIDYGVQHWKGVLEVAQQNSVTDLGAIIQAYNFGKAWLSFIKDNGGVYTADSAKAYSLLMVQKFPGQFTCGGDTSNFRYPACYGDFSYSGKVLSNLQNIQSGGASIGDEKFQIIMAEALKYHHWPYSWGGDNPTAGFDCSGLIMWSYRQVGIKLPRTAQEQYNATARIQANELKPGDLVFFTGTSDHAFISHVGIFVGNGQMYNSSSSGIDYADLTSNYWKSKIYAYGRVY